MLALLELVERTLPIERIVFDNSVDPDAQTNPEGREVGGALIASARATFLSLVASGMDVALAKKAILELEPFYNHPEIVEALQS